MGWEDVTPSEAVENADWILSRLHPFTSYDVGSVIPTGFAAYARILHPAFIEGAEIRWSELAALSGKVIHPEVQFHAIAAPTPFYSAAPGPYNLPLRNGILSASQMAAMIRLLGQHTTTPDRCWFCLWDGYGYFTEGGSVALRFYRDSVAGRWARWRHEHRLLALRIRKPRHAPGRRVAPNSARSYLLFTGPVTKAAGWRDGPNIWWPDDRAWCVASEIDLPYSYVGGSKELVAEILNHPALEAVKSDLGDGITYDSDKVNSIA